MRFPHLTKNKLTYNDQRGNLKEQSSIFVSILPILLIQHLPFDTNSVLLLDTTCFMRIQSYNITVYFGRKKIKKKNGTNIEGFPYLDTYRGKEEDRGRQLDDEIPYIL